MDRYWIRWTRPDGETGFVLRNGEDTIEGRALKPRAEAERKAALLQGSSSTGTIYTVEIASA